MMKENKKYIALLLVFVLLLTLVPVMALAGEGDLPQGAEPTSTATGSTEPTSTATGSTEPTSTATGSAEPTSTATGSTEPTPTATQSAEPTSTATGSAEPTSTATGSTEPTPTATQSAVPSAPVPAPSTTPSPSQASPDGSNGSWSDAVPMIVTFAPLLSPPEAPSPQDAPYGTRLRELDISPPSPDPDYGFRWYWGGGDPLFPFGQGPVDKNGDGGDYQLVDPGKTEFHVVSTYPWQGGILEGNSYVYIKVNLIKRVPTATGDNQLNAVYGNAPADVAVSVDVANAFRLEAVSGLSIAGIGSNGLTLQADLDAGATGGVYHFEDAALEQLNALEPGSYDILFHCEGNEYNEAVPDTKIGVYTVEGSSSGPGEVKEGEDGMWTFAGNFLGLKAIRLNGTPFDLLPQSDALANLAYPGYNGTAGIAEAGSVDVTLYKEFLATLPAGKYTLEVEFDNDGVPQVGAAEFTLVKNAAPVEESPAAEPTAAAARTPKTGDETSLTLWSVLILTAGTCLFGGLVYGRKKMNGKK